MSESAAKELKEFFVRIQKVKKQQVDASRMLKCKQIELHDAMSMKADAEKEKIEAQQLEAGGDAVSMHEFNVYI